jgi:hypothetical protein
VISTLLVGDHEQDVRSRVAAFAHFGDAIRGRIVPTARGAACLGTPGALRTADQIGNSACTVRVRASIEFDPEPDHITRVEVVRNGEALEVETSSNRSGILEVDAEIDIDAPSWLALRLIGDKLGETPADRKLPQWLWTSSEKIITYREMGEAIEEFLDARGLVRPVAAHTAPVWVELGSARTNPGLAAIRARESLERINEFEARLDEARIEDEGLWDWVPYADAVPVEFLRKNRESLLSAIAEARARYQELATPP